MAKPSTTKNLTKDSPAVETPAKADYGIDAPKIARWMATRGALLALFGAIVFYVNRETNPQAGRTIGSMTFFPGLGFMLGAAVMFWSSRVGKLKMRDEILSSITWKGDEKVLDVGCGRGLMLIGAAKRLNKSGKATGCDIWSTFDLSNNSSAAALGNAKAEGVSDRIKLDTADARKLPYPDASFDVVLSSLAIHNIRAREGRELAIAEIWRVLKPGGTVAILDIFQTANYAKDLETKGAEVTLSGMSLLWCLPTRWLKARKP